MVQELFGPLSPLGLLSGLGPLSPLGPVPDRARLDPLGPVHVHGLAPELLAAILVRLPLEELVRCRQVCGRWRAVIATMRAHEAHFAYGCGACDLAAIEQLPGVRQFAAFPYDVPWCTCGRLLPGPFASTMLSVASTVPDVDRGNKPVLPGAHLAALRHLSFEAQHGAGQSVPPALWKQLRPSRDLAIMLTQLLAQVVAQLLR